VESDSEGRDKALKDLTKEVWGHLPGDNKGGEKGQGKGEEKPRDAGKITAFGNRLITNADGDAQKILANQTQKLLAVQQPKPPEPAAAARKIIRTGEIE